MAFKALFRARKSKERKESEVAQSCPTLRDPVDCSLRGSSVHGVFQARILEWVAIFFSRRSSWPRDWTRSLVLWADSLPSEPPGKPKSCQKRARKDPVSEKRDCGPGDNTEFRESVTGGTTLISQEKMLVIRASVPLQASAMPRCHQYFCQEQRCRRHGPHVFVFNDPCAFPPSAETNSRW